MTTLATQHAHTGRATCVDPDTALRVAAAVGAVALATLVGLDGSPLWRAVRMITVLALGALVAAHAHRRPAVTGAIGTGGGILMCAVAAGFAPHWVDGRLTVTALAAAVLALAALASTVLGARLLMQRRRWWHRLGVGTAAFVTAGVTLFVVAPAVAATNAPRPQLGDRPADVGLGAADVALRTDDGVDIAGWYVPSANRAAVVLLHGAGSTRSDVLDHAAVLAEGGFGVLLIDARGHGESTGHSMDLGWHGDDDIAAATRYLASRSDVDASRIGVVGMSMGGEEAIGASAGDPLIRAVVAEGATGRSGADSAWLSDVYGLRGSLTEALARVRDRVTDALTDASVPITLHDAVERSAGTEYLLIAAERVADEGHAATFIAAAAPARVDIWTVPGATHTSGLSTHPQEWARRVLGFLDATLLAPE